MQDPGGTPPPNQPVVLVVEDDPAIAALLLYNLQDAGFAVIEAADGQDALDRFAAAPPRIIVLDWLLPSLSGIEVTRRIRQHPAGHSVPIVMVSARGREEDAVHPLSAGVDDFVTKPFTFANLLARMRGLLRRADGAVPHEQISFSDIVMDLTTRRVRRGGQPVHMSPTEFKLLHFLMRHPGRVFSRAEVLDAVWGRAVEIQHRTLDVHIGRLRHALARPNATELIQNVRGTGYALDETSA